jgi:hypothetical protein
MTDVSNVHTRRLGLATEQSQRRDRIMAETLPALAALAYDLINLKGKPNTSFLMLCIDVEEKRWRPIVDFLMPNHDWSQYKKGAEILTIRGHISSTFYPILWAELPKSIHLILEVPPSGMVKALILAAGGATFYHLVPQPRETIQ